MYQSTPHRRNLYTSNRKRKCLLFWNLFHAIKQGLFCNQKHRPPRSKCSLCWWGWGVPHPVLDEGYSILLMEGFPLSQVWTEGGLYPTQSWMGGTLWYPLPGYPPSQVWTRGYLIQSWTEGTPGTPHPDLGWGTPCPDLGWGTPRPWIGYPSPPDKTWDGVPPPSRLGMRYPSCPDLSRPEMGYPPTPRQVWTDWNYYLPSSFKYGR